jgi:hypothetical protein
MMVGYSINRGMIQSLLTASGFTNRLLPSRLVVGFTP